MQFANQNLPSASTSNADRVGRPIGPLPNPWGGPCSFSEWRVRPLQIGCAYRQSFDVRTDLTEKDRILAECDIRLGLQDAGWLRFRIERSAIDPQVWTVTRLV
jgi:hypothetical protein